MLASKIGGAMQKLRTPFAFALMVLLAGCSGSKKSPPKSEDKNHAEAAPSEEDAPESEEVSAESSDSDSRPGEGFRGLRWGDTAEKLKEEFNAKQEPDRPDAWYTYDKIGGYECVFNFSLHKGKLYFITGGITQELTNDNSYVDAYRRISGLLKKKYGKPTNEIEKWSNDAYKEKPEKIGFSVQAGIVTLLTEWETEETRIVLLCNKMKDHPGVSVTYVGKKLYAEYEKAEEKKNLEGL